MIAAGTLFTNDTGHTHVAVIENAIYIDATPEAR